MIRALLGPLPPFLYMTAFYCWNPVKRMLLHFPSSTCNQTRIIFLAILEVIINVAGKHSGPGWLHTLPYKEGPREGAYFCIPPPPPPPTGPPDFEELWQQNISRGFCRGHQWNLIEGELFGQEHMLHGLGTLDCHIICCSNVLQSWAIPIELGKAVISASKYSWLS
jgi:hypothetical protein